MSSYELYNVSFTDLSPLCQYNPYRDSAIDSSWTITYPDGDARTNAYTTYLEGASVDIQWVGTAIWVYGQANLSQYEVQTSWGSGTVLGEGTSSAGGLLYSQQGLNYGPQSISLIALSGPVTIQNVIITVGMGDLGTSLETRNVSAVTGSDSDLEVNPYFTISSETGWLAEYDYGGDGLTENYPRIETGTPGAWVSFNVSTAVAVAIYGSLRYDQGGYSVNIDPAPPLWSNTTFQLNATLPWLVRNELKFLATGLDRTQNYTINMTNREAGLNVAQIVLYDAPPASTSSSASSQASSASAISTATGISLKSSRMSHSLSAGSIAGIVVACMVTLCTISVLIVCLVYRHKRRRRQVDIDSPYDEYCDQNEVYHPREGNEREFQNSMQEHGLPLSLPSPYTKCYVESTSAVQSDAASSSQVQDTGSTGLKAGVRATSPLATSAGSAERSTSRAVDPYFVIREEDAGRIPVIEPPLYDPAWNESALPARQSIGGDELN